MFYLMQNNFRYKKKGNSNMALMEIDALSGYQFDADEINKLTKKHLPKIQRVELEKGDTKINLYFRSVNYFLLHFLYFNTMYHE